ncbi:MAG: hypothetical protein M0C28_46080 [Candidatus Moduliflexus flocculans]|nr:hypothetical protein [Candidatus Moduliflexus flocculans]
MFDVGSSGSWLPSPTAYGGSSMENVFLVNGVNTTNPRGRRIRLPGQGQLQRRRGGPCRRAGLQGRIRQLLRRGHRRPDPVRQQPVPRQRGLLHGAPGRVLQGELPDHRGRGPQHPPGRPGQLAVLPGRRPAGGRDQEELGRQLHDRRPDRQGQGLVLRRLRLHPVGDAARQLVPAEQLHGPLRRSQDLRRAAPQHPGLGFLPL